MQIDIDTSKLPPGYTEKQIYEAIKSSLMVYIGDYQGCESHTAGVVTAAFVCMAMIQPVPPEQKPPEQKSLNSKDLSYLRFVGKQRNVTNDWMPGWRENKATRAKLKRLKLVTVKHYPAAGMGDVATIVCELTAKGGTVLRRGRLTWKDPA